MGENPIVSIVMPIYKHSEEQLTTAIYSILNQTFNNFELIITYGSDDTKNFEIISLINDKRIRYFKIKGYINCLNYGISQAKGKYIARMDSDDIARPNRIEEQVKFLEENPNISLCSCLVKYFGDTSKRKFSKYTREITLLNLIKCQEIVHPSMMFRKELNIKYEHIMPLEDCLLFRKLLLAGKKLEIIDKILSENYISEKSIMARYPKLMKYRKSKMNIYSLSKYYNYPLSFTDEIFKKKDFSKDDVLELLNLIKFLNNEIHKNIFNVYEISTPYLLYALDKCKQKNPVLFSPIFIRTLFLYKLKLYLKQCIRFIFSIFNEYIDNKKIKIICTLGLKFRLKN
jgi:glycosyltransferase involved in cell wall biosynthesis